MKKKVSNCSCLSGMVFKTIGGHQQGEGMVWGFLASTQHKSVNRNLVLLSLMVSRGILWHLMPLCSKQLLDFAGTQKVFYLILIPVGGLA